MLITLFSDASLCQEQCIGGWAAWLKSDRGTMRTGGAIGVKVHDTALAEAMAAVNGLSFGLRVELIKEGDVVLIQTDNNAVMTILEGTARRKATPSVKKRRKLSWSRLRADVRQRNYEIRAIAGVFAALVEQNGLTVRWRHVKGHRGTVDTRSAVNTYCDKQAKTHMRAARGRDIPSMMERDAAREPLRQAA